MVAPQADGLPSACCFPSAPVPPDESDFQTRLRDAKLAALAELAAGAGHEINNPIAVIAGRARLLLQDETDPDRRRHLATIAAQALRVRDMIGDLMLFARPPVGRPERVELATLAAAVLHPFCEDGAPVTLKKTSAAVWVLADPLQLAVAVEALLRNAVEAGGTVTVAVAKAGESVTLTVSDDGPGLSSDDRDHAFDPFYSGRQAGRGLGFGLPKCWRIVTGAGGTLTADSRRGRTVFRITLPRAADEAPPTVEADSTVEEE